MAPANPPAAAEISGQPVVSARPDRRSSCAGSAGCSAGNDCPPGGALKTRRLLALSGSLRAASLNTAMLAMAATCAPPGLVVKQYAGLGRLPLFNQDLEAREPRQVAHLRSAIAAADALLIASPEYAHGISGVMKNALDWMVSSGVLVGKPVVLWNASPRASHAIAALRETLSVMSARLQDAAELALRVGFDASGRLLPNPDPPAMLRALLAIKDVLDRETTALSSV